MSDLRVYRFPVPIADAVALPGIPVGAVILSVAAERNSGPDGETALDVWVLVDVDETRMEDRQLLIVGTGHPLPSDFRGRFIGTVPTPGGALIWHVFDATTERGWPLPAGTTLTVAAPDARRGTPTRL